MCKDFCVQREGGGGEVGRAVLRQREETSGNLNGRIVEKWSSSSLGSSRERRRSMDTCPRTIFGRDGDEDDDNDDDDDDAAAARRIEFRYGAW